MAREVFCPLIRPLAFALQVGFFAGLIWGLAGVVLHFFGFSEVKPASWAGPWLNKSAASSWVGALSGLAVYTVISILASLVYAAVLRKAKGPWPGILYGLFWYLLLFFGIGHALGLLPAWNRMEMHSHVSELCRFLLWGAFIGYSITFEFTDERTREPGMG